LSNIIRRRASAFEEHSLMSQAWERRGLALRAADALVDNGILTLDDLHRAHELENSIWQPYQALGERA